MAAGIVTAIIFALAASASPAAAEQYTVAPHDTLYSIARHFGVPVAALAAANGLRDPSKLRAGTVISIPDHAAPHGAQAMTRRQPPKTSLRQSPASRYPAGTGAAGAGTGSMYTVRSGDTLYHLARTHGVTVAELEAINHLSSDLLQVGQVVLIPMGPRRAGPLGSPPFDDGPATPQPSPGGIPGPLVDRGPDRTSGTEPPPVHPGPEHRAVLGQRVTAAAARYIGTPYVWGGASPVGVDCSGLVYLVYAPYVSHMPRTSYDQWKIGMGVDSSALAPGDLVFFETDGSGASHVGIYIGDGQFIHPALGPHRVVVDRLDMPYYASHYLGARRVL